METELTKKMKHGIRYFKPDMPTQMRTIRFAEEVWTPTGIVDVIRFEDYKENYHEFCAMIEYETMDSTMQDIMRSANNGKELGECKISGMFFPNDNCKNCFWKKQIYDVGMLITCYECKITLADFKSKNGHNFHGNKNYYVVPEYLVEHIINLVQDDIGIIAYYEKSDSFRIKKECQLREVDKDLQIKLLYDAFKKWVDKFGKEY